MNDKNTVKDEQLDEVTGGHGITAKEKICDCCGKPFVRLGTERYCKSCRELLENPSATPTENGAHGGW